MRTSKKKLRRRPRSVNKNSRINTRRVYGLVETTTERRDADSLFILAETDKHGNGAQRVFLYPRNNDFGPVVLDGHESRTLYELLQRHFEATGRKTR